VESIFEKERRGERKSPAEIFVLSLFFKGGLL
jgi:hypothetical protein